MSDEAANPIAFRGPSRVAIFFQRQREKLAEFFFAPAAPEPLGVARLLFFAGVFAIFYTHHFADWATVPAASYKPVWLFKRFGWQVLSAGWLNGLTYAWLASLLMAAIGLFTPLAIASSMCIGVYLFGLPSSFGKVGHGDACLVIAMFFLLTSYCANAFSIDAILKRVAFRHREARRREAIAARTAGGEYRWPFRAMQVLLAIIFCASGCTKLMYSGLQWVFSDHLQILLMQHRYGLKSVPWPAAATFFAERPMLCRAMAGGSLLLEILFPLALFFRRLRAPIVLGALSMQIGIGLVMGVYFTQFLLLYMFYLPWLKWPVRLPERPA